MGVTLFKIRETSQVAPNQGRSFDPRVTASTTLPLKKLVEKNPNPVTKHVESVLKRVQLQNARRGSPNTYPKIYPESPDYYFRKRGR